MKDILFKRVKCHAFLRKVNDGRFVETHDSECGKECEYIDTNNPNFELKCNYDGSFEFLKTYYELRKKEFEGIVVGHKDIIVSGYLVVETDYDYSGLEYTKIYKHPKEIVKCSIVYFSDNKKRFVPIEELEEME